MNGLGLVLDNSGSVWFACFCGPEWSPDVGASLGLSLGLGVAVGFGVWNGHALGLFKLLLDSFGPFVVLGHVWCSFLSVLAWYI